MLGNVQQKDSPEAGLHPMQKSYGGLIIAGLTGAAVVSLYAVTFPFLLPALRKICLPYVPATDTQLRNVLQALKGRRGNVIDLGSGDGRLVLQAAKHGFLAEGVELNHWLVLYSRLHARSMALHRRTYFHCKDLWKMDLSKYDNVIIFGVSEMMEDIEKKASKEMKNGGCLIACRFPLPLAKPAMTIGSGIDTVWVYYPRCE